MKDLRFLTRDEIIQIHSFEISISGGLKGIRDLKRLEAACESVKASFDGKYLMNFFEMGATYINSIIFNHPFNDGNKRTALAVALTFFYVNGVELFEKENEEFADVILDLTNHKITKQDLVSFFKKRVK